MITHHPPVGQPRAANHSSTVCPVRRLGVPAQALTWVVITGAATVTVAAVAPGPLLGVLRLPAPG